MIKTLNSKIENNLNKFDEALGRKCTRDGIIDEKQYLEAPVKILWILKEANSPEDDIHDMRGAIASLLDGEEIHKDWAKTFTALAYSTYGILNNKMMESYPKIVGNAPVVESLQKTAFINVKKIPGVSATIVREMNDFYSKYNLLLKEQIEIINPDVFIFGGSFRFFQNEWFEIFGNKLYEDISKSHIQEYQYGNKLLLSTYHPNQRKITRDVYCNSIIDSVMRWKGN